MNNKIHIDNSQFMELIDTLATQITEMKFGEGNFGEDGFGDEVHFRVMKYYNETYDEYEGLFNNIANIYSDNER